MKKPKGWEENEMKPIFIGKTLDGRYYVEIPDEVWHKFFAGLAMMGVLANPTANVPIPNDVDLIGVVALMSCKSADALLSALAGKDGG